MNNKVQKPINYRKEKRNYAYCVDFTIIVLVILAAVSISAVYNSNIIGFATNGAINYAEESKRENEILDHTASILESAISNIESINAGNGGTSGSTGEEPEPPEVGIDFGDMTEEEFINNYVGKYVDYTPTSGIFSDHVGETYNNYDTVKDSDDPSNTTLSTDTNLKWRILFAENNKLTLISDTSTNENFGLGGANGYNNGVLLLNNACKEMYSNNSLGAVGRSLKIEDIESVSSYDKTTYTNYGKEYTPASKYYPNIFAQEEGGNTSGSYGTLGRSEQSSYVTGSSQAGTLRGKFTYYYYTMSNSYMNQKYVDLFNCSPRSWLATRCVYYDSNNNGFGFRMFLVSGGGVDAYNLYYSYENTYSISYAIRPVVEIDLTKVNVGVTGTGADGDGYSLTLK